MFNGNKCPECNKLVITFNKFIRVTDPGKTMECRQCGTSLKLRGYYTFYIILAVIVGLAIPTFLVGTGQAPTFFNELAFHIKAIIAVIYLLLWIVGTIFLGWLLIGWKKA